MGWLDAPATPSGRLPGARAKSVSLRPAASAAVNFLKTGPTETVLWATPNNLAGGRPTMSSFAFGDKLLVAGEGAKKPFAHANEAITHGRVTLIRRGRLVPAMTMIEARPSLA
jgi:hypothetical protein